VDGAGFDLAIPARDKGDAIPPVKDIGLEAPVSVNKVAKLYSKEKGWSCRLNQLRVFIGRVLFSHLPLRIICREHLREHLWRLFWRRWGVICSNDMLFPRHLAFYQKFQVPLRLKQCL
jgi:hypothetical protein